MPINQRLKDQVDALNADISDTCEKMINCNQAGMFLDAANCLRKLSKLQFQVALINETLWELKALEKRITK